MSDYDFERFETIIENIIRKRCEVSDYPEDLEVGENISDLPEIKVIFDGFGLAEELYHNGRSFRLEDDVVMVDGETMGEEDEEYEFVKEKLKTFAEFATSDGPCNPDSQSFAVFIHENSGDPEFEFPEHDSTPWGIVHRPAEEVCLYVWWDRESDTFDVIPLEDRIDNSNSMNVDVVMDILNAISVTHELDEDEEDVAFPTTRPAEGGGNKSSPAWPFSQGWDAQSTTVEETDGDSDDELLEGEEVEATPKEIPTSQDIVGILEKYCAKHGLPKEVGCRGWISYYCNYNYNDKFIGKTEEGSKGWLFVDRDDDGQDGNSSYTNVSELLHVVGAWVDDDVDETTLNVPTDDGEGRMVEIQNEESDGKSWDFDPVDGYDMDNIYQMIREKLEEEGEEVPEDDDDVDIQEFLWSYCMDSGGESYYSTTYGSAFLEFDDGTSMGIRRNTNGELYIFSFNSSDVNKDTIFE